MTSAKPVTLVLVDDHRMVADAMSEWLKSLPGIDLRGVYSDSATALAAMSASPPDLALVDQSMPGISGLELVRSLRGSGSPTRFAMLTTYGHPMLVAEALDAGMDGFLLKEDSKSEILKGIESLAKGECVLSSNLDMDGVRDAMATLRITNREREILDLLIQGHSATDIGRKLGIGQRTVETHRNSLVAKFGARNAMELVRKCTEAGF